MHRLLRHPSWRKIRHRTTTSSMSWRNSNCLRRNYCLKKNLSCCSMTNSMSSKKKNCWNSTKR